MRITFRKPESEDSKKLLGWRNSPEVYRHLLHPQPVTEEEHKKWFEKISTDKSILFFIVQCDKNDCGTIRFDLINSDSAEVGIYLATEFQGLRLGREILQQSEKFLLTIWPEIKKLKALVLKENIASQKSFESSGFNMESFNYIKVISKDR